MGNCRVWAAALALLLTASAQAAPFTIYNQDAGTGAGFDDQQPVASVAGNEATTLGGQRMAAVQYAASIVLSRVASSVRIRIAASFAGNNGGAPLACSRNAATLGRGGATQYSANFAGAPRADTDYPLSLANALAGRRVADVPGVALSFNPRLDAGNDNCLRGTRWYYGLDGHPGDGQLDFVATAVHELLHGLGFQSLVAMTDSDQASIGQFPRFSNDPDSRYSDIFSSFIQDVSLSGQPFWPALTADERAASMTHGRFLVWGEANTDSAAAGYLHAGLTQGRVQLYAPGTIEPGSSVSHWANELVPDQIMEPREDPETDVRHGLGLSVCVLENLGWQLANGTRCPDIASDAIAGQPDVAISNDTGDEPDSGSGGGGGGCTIDPNAAFDPLWLLMLSLAAGILYRRRRQTLGG